MTATPVPPPPPPQPPREPDDEQDRYNLGSGVYGLITVSAMLAAESASKESYVESVAGVVLAIILYWLAHSYSEFVGWRVRRAQRLTQAGLGWVLRRELPILVGAAPPLLAVLIVWATGAALGTAITVALWTAVATILATEVAAGVQAELTGRELAIQALVGTAFGLLILGLRLVLH
jgi:hypothetical protein